MESLHPQNLVIQTANYLKKGIEQGRWNGKLPGVGSLAEQLGISKDTIRSALLIIEKQGIIEPSEAGKARLIAQSAASEKIRLLRVAILLPEPLEGDNAYTKEMMLRVRHSIENAGHVCFFVSQSLSQLGFKPSRVIKLIQKTNADAWIVLAAPRDVLEAVEGIGIPIFAIGGRSADLKIARAYSELSHAMNEAIGNLVSLGHKRIVAVTPYVWRKPTLGGAAQHFIRCLQKHHLPCSSYNLPDWDDSSDGLMRLLDSLFRVTPPTALLVLEPTHCYAMMNYLAQKNMQVPRDVSVLCMLTDPIFEWRKPPLSHFAWPLKEFVKEVTRWVNDLACGKNRITLKAFSAKYVAGGTIGPAKI